MRVFTIRSIGARAGGLIAALTLISSLAFAQATIPLKAKVPFDFYIGNKLLPAGEYVILPLVNQAGIRISNSAGPIANLITTPSENPDRAKSRLVFHRYGDVYFLSAFYWEGYPGGHELPASRTEAEVRKGGARTTEAVAVNR